MGDEKCMGPGAVHRRADVCYWHESCVALVAPVLRVNADFVVQGS